MPMMKNSTLKIIVYTTNPVRESINPRRENKLNSSKTMVPDYCVENIMNFARSYRVARSKSTGPVEMMMN
jgi:hypothetical protein